MEKERKTKMISLAALIVAVLGLTVAFAAMSQTLTINGTASLNAAEWDIHFENLQYVAIGTGASAGTPVMSKTSITGINVVITKPNDAAVYYVDIVNKGTIDAKISSIEKSELCTLQSPVEACDWDNNGIVTQEDINKVNNNISFVIGYDTIALPLKKDDILNRGEKRKIVIIVSYSKYTEDALGEKPIESTELPKRDLKFNDLSVKINYVQAD